MRMVAADLSSTSTLSEVRHWIQVMAPGGGSPDMVTEEQLQILVRHLKEAQVPFPLLEVSDDAATVTSALMKTADIDGSDELDDHEFEMLWDLCAHAAPPPPSAPPDQPSPRAPSNHVPGCWASRSPPTRARRCAWARRTLSSARG